ncbi:MAG: HIT domain-containing protein [Thiothrix sp.]|uniref:HIT domain-containing protein n=1 Tax=Thiothrix sp. TaxID=1032 RepID=UPI0026155161|nr:HIT domain-containing protein [Thiothrix sp.]MDD5391698.1 HIT domain-containing protein [Thiothrix sp.]
MSGTGFVLHPQLAKDTHFVSDLPLCRVLLMDEARYPWFILVPRRGEIREIHELSQDERNQLWVESDQISRALLHLYEPDKLNIASLGNMVPQLHLHHIARFQTDAAWPAPVWGKFVPQAYEPAVAAQRLQTMCQVLHR